MQRLAQGEHDVVRHVHGQRDGAHPCLGEPGRHPRRRRSGHVDPSHDAGDIAVATRPPTDGGTVSQRHGIPTVVGGGSRRGQRKGGVDEGRPGGVPVFAGNAADGEAVAAVRGDIDLDRLAVESEQRNRVLPRHEVRSIGAAGQHKDAVVVVTDAELLDRADHPGRHVAVGLARGDLEATGQHATGQDDGDEVAGLEVVRTADDPLGLATPVRNTHIDGAPVDRLAVLLRLRRLGQHATNHQGTRDVTPVQALLLEADLDERGGDVDARRVSGDGDVFAQPINRNAHQISIPNCAAKRTSPSIISRMSETPVRNISARSIPMPKAKP